SCVDGCVINQVEDRDSYLSQPSADALDPVQAPTDLVIPSDMPFVWKQLRPLIQQGKSYGEALQAKLTEFCPRLVRDHNITDPLSDEANAVLKVKANLEAGCDSDPDKLIRFVYWHHGKIDGKRDYLEKD